MTYRKIILLFVILSACSKTKDTRLFELISNEKSNINFNNTLDYTENLNPYTYRNFYNGGGVAIGDFNNDSLQDIFFAGNLVSNKLYLNKTKKEKFGVIKRETKTNCLRKKMISMNQEHLENLLI